MVEQLIIITIVGLLAACLGALLALRFQSAYWKNIHAQHEAWERAQQGHHRSWEEKQERLIAEAEVRITAQVQQVRNDWHRWEEKDAGRLVEQMRQQEMSDEHARLERELARLPRVEETSMVLTAKPSIHAQEQTSTHWRPAMLQGANLAGLDLSHRYLGRADLRNAQLSRTNLFLADLSGACLADADLSEADLTGANVANADLRGAILTGANLQVADLNNAILTGANLLAARNLTTQQVYSAIYDSTTQLDAEIDITVPRTSSMHNIRPEFPATPPDTERSFQDVAPFSEEDESFIETMYEETMPALVVVKPEIVQVVPDEMFLPVLDATYENDISHEELELLSTSQPESEENQSSSVEMNPPVEIQESRYSKKPVKSTRKSKYNGRKRARVS